jgi:hypothetical protein
MIIHFEAYVDRIGVAGGDGDDVRLPLAIEIFAAPAVGYVEFLVHGSRLPFRRAEGKRAGDVFGLQDTWPEGTGFLVQQFSWG